MNNVPYTIVLPTDYGQMLVNRNDVNQTSSLLKTNKAVDSVKINFANRVCMNAAENSNALDVGSNFGTYALSMAKILANRNGTVHAFEAQRIIYYMLCGSIALNSVENCHPHFCCVGDNNEDIDIPKFNYYSTMNFGSVEFGSPVQTERLHQERGSSSEKVQQVRIDDLNLSNVIYAKFDVEGMEPQAISGAINTISSSLPILQIEILKTPSTNITDLINHLNYEIYSVEGDLICIPHHLKNVYKFS